MIKKTSKVDGEFSEVMAMYREYNQLVMLSYTHLRSVVVTVACNMHGPSFLLFPKSVVVHYSDKLVSKWCLQNMPLQHPFLSLKIFAVGQSARLSSPIKVSIEAP